MDDVISTITFDNDALADMNNDLVYLNGSVTVDYSAGTYTGNFSATGNGTNDSQSIAGELGDVHIGPPEYYIQSDNLFFHYDDPQPTSAIQLSYTGSMGMVYSATNAPLMSFPACYMRGTLIRTNGGEVAVQDLAISDLVITTSGEQRAIKWIGHRAYAGRFANANPDTLPICVKAHAIAENAPCRDLWVSPSHALYIDDVLIPALSLVNGCSIVKADRVESVEYWHIELDSHDILLAENLPAESFIDDNSRAIFHNAATFHACYPDAEAVEPLYCAPRLEDGHIVADIRRRIAERAGLAIGAAGFGVLEGFVDVCEGFVVAGWARDLLYPDAPVCLEIVVGGEVAALTYANLYRADLAEAGMGSGHYGFHVDLPAMAKGFYPLLVRRAADQAILRAGAADPRRMA